MEPASPYLSSTSLNISSFSSLCCPSLCCHSSSVPFLLREMMWPCGMSHPTPHGPTRLSLFFTCVPALLLDPSLLSRPSSSHPSLLLCFKILLCSNVLLYTPFPFPFPSLLVSSIQLVISPSDETYTSSLPRLTSSRTPVTSCSSVLCPKVSFKSSSSL